MPPLEVDPIGLLAAVALALTVTGGIAYLLGWAEGVRAERERQQEQSGWRGADD
jgi:hypothetical protein